MGHSYGELFFVSFCCYCCCKCCCCGCFISLRPASFSVDSNMEEEVGTDLFSCLKTGVTNNTEKASVKDRR